MKKGLQSVAPDGGTLLCLEGSALCEKALRRVPVKYSALFASKMQEGKPCLYLQLDLQLICFCHFLSQLLALLPPPLGFQHGGLLHIIGSQQIYEALLLLQGLQLRLPLPLDAFVSPAKPDFVYRTHLQSRDAIKDRPGLSFTKQLG